MSLNTITDHEFEKFRRFIYEAAGITLSPAKKALVSGRLAKRVQQRELKSYGEYFRLLESGEVPDEVQMAIDLLTTNETYFFREMKHFQKLKECAMLARKRSEPFRVWSAASSTGEEAYSIAMILFETLEAFGTPWEVIGSDISQRVLERARKGHYPVERTTHISSEHLKKFCLKGVGSQQGTVLVDASLRSRVKFLHINLNTSLPQLGMFDVIFLRNVMIYFNNETKRQVVARLLTVLKPEGYFFVGHSESLNDISTAVQAVAPSIYLKP
ncbi:MAG: protein-glutamate O-methyltransferase CheR [Pseudomonadota bacterium]